MIDGFQPVASTTLPVEIAELIRDAVLNRALKPGVRINETALAEQLKTSRGPIREALRLLEREGLLEYKPRRGSFVRELSVADVQEIYTLRGHLEALAARLALPEFPLHHVKRMQAIVNEMDHHGKEGRVARIVIADTEFHACICRASNHGRLYEAWERLNVQIGVLFIHILNEQVVTPEEVGPRHQRIVDALQTGTAVTVEKEILEHYAGVSRQLEEHLDKATRRETRS